MTKRSPHYRARSVAEESGIFEMGEDLGYTPEETRHLIATTPRTRPHLRRDVDQAARLANQHQAETGHRIPRAGPQAWKCRTCDFTV